MGKSHVVCVASIRAPIEIVFARLTDHDDVRNWPGVSDARLIKEGSPRNGVGAVRAVEHPFLTIHEEVVAFEPPVRFEYRIVRGMPIVHHGTISFEARGDETQVSWDVRVSSKVPGLAGLLGMVLRRGLRDVLAYVARVSAPDAPRA